MAGRSKPSSRRARRSRAVGVAALLLAAALIAPLPPAHAHTAISFRTGDGVAIRGYQFGDGRAVVILSHMYGTDQRIWRGAATPRSPTTTEASGSPAGSSSLRRPTGIRWPRSPMRRAAAGGPSSLSARAWAAPFP